MNDSILFQPEFQSEGIDAIEIVSKKSFVSNEAEFLVETQRSTVCDLSLQHHLNIHRQIQQLQLKHPNKYPPKKWYFGGGESI